MKILSFALMMMVAVACSPVAKAPAKGVGQSALVQKTPGGASTATTTGTSTSTQTGDTTVQTNGTQTVADANQNVDLDLYSDNGDRKALEQKMLADGGLKSSILKFEQDASVDCANPRIGQLHRNADCNERLCDFVLDISCLSRVSADGKTQNDTLRRLNVEGSLNYDEKTYTVKDPDSNTGEFTLISDREKKKD